MHTLLTRITYSHGSPANERYTQVQAQIGRGLRDQHPSRSAQGAANAVVSVSHCQVAITTVAGPVVIECEWCGTTTRIVGGKCLSCSRELSPMLVFARSREDGGVEMCVQLDGELHTKRVGAGHARTLIKQLVEAL
jgi:hypothetical protein